jgi:putative redox protein
MPVQARWVSGFECVTRGGLEESAHELIGDEPVALGGTDKGFNPFSLLQASLANCTIVTVVAEAEARGITLEGLEVDVTHKQNILCDGPHDPKQRELRITGLRRTVRVRGPIDQEQLDRLQWAAEHCPVSNSFEGGLPITTRVVLEDR